MSLYYEAASIITDSNQTGSLKSRVFALKVERARQGRLLALIKQTARYDLFLKEVIDHSGFIAHEPKVNPLLALLLTHDHFFADRGIAASVQHPLRQAVEKHKARLQSEFTKARLRRKCATVEALEKALNAESGQIDDHRPRWVRLNVLRTPNDFSERVLPKYRKEDSLKSLSLSQSTKSYIIDQHVPSLYGFQSDHDLTSSKAYDKGEIILQDKASCFPPYLLLGDQSAPEIGDVLDACAAPGNKTTQLAALMYKVNANGNIFACERDSKRSETLQAMVKKAGADERVRVLAKQDFLALKHDDPSFANVTHLLLDPSCSGSGIVGREDIPKLALPEDPKKSKDTNLAKNVNGKSQSRKRKRGGDGADPRTEMAETTVNVAGEEQAPIAVNGDRLTKLSNLQTHIVEHAMHFPAARRITYSTCSIHRTENEEVVSRVLTSKIAQTRGWRTLKRDEQVDGMRKWKHRGEALAEPKANKVPDLPAQDIEACIRCYAGDEEGTMGFFVCGFVRDVPVAIEQHHGNSNVDAPDEKADAAEDEGWEGFDDT